LTSFKQPQNLNMAIQSLVLPSAFPLMGVAVASTMALNVSCLEISFCLVPDIGLSELQMYQIINTSKHRKASGVEYPNAYAGDAEAKADPKKMVLGQ
jgi:hypothetical protein